MRALWFALPLAALLAGAPAAQAQFNPFGPTQQTGLVDSDYRALGDAMTRLLARPDLAPGAEEKWTNPRTKSTGSVSVMNGFERQDLTCMAVRYEALARGRPPVRTRELNWCKTPQGWKIAP